MIPAPGRHMIYAASLAAAVGEELGLSVPEIERGVALYEPAGSRMRVHRLKPATAACSTTATTPTRSPCPHPVSPNYYHKIMVLSHRIAWCN